MSTSPQPDPANAAAGVTSRVRLFILVTVALVAIAGGTVAKTIVDQRAARAGGSEQVSETIGAIASGGAADMLLFRNFVPGQYTDRAGLVPVAAPDGSRSVLPLTCSRLHYAGGSGLCLTTSGFLLDTYAYVLGADFEVRSKLAIGGIASRARVSPDGRYGATTVFVQGHSYADDGFSTETALIDLETGTKIANLEDFTVRRDGKEFRAIDFNFWGVTFTRDSNRYYATLGTGGRTYLVEGDVRAREMRVLLENVECPALSPDDTRVAFKKRMTAPGTRPEWRFHVLNLATMVATPLSEPRSIDDQIEWLDSEQVLYGDESDVWVMQADGSGTPRTLLRNALSPAVVRAGASGVANGTEALKLQPVDLAITASAPAGVAPEGEVTYSATTTNNGPGTATGVRITHDLPNGWTFKGARAQSLSQAYGCASFDARIACDTPSLALGESLTLEFTAVASGQGSARITFSARATEPDANASNDSAVLEVASGR